MISEREIYQFPKSRIKEGLEIPRKNRAAVEEGSAEDGRRLFDTNFWGPGALIKAVLPDMREKHSGVIMNISSIAALQTAPGSGY